MLSMTTSGLASLIGSPHTSYCLAPARAGCSPISLPIGFEMRYHRRTQNPRQAVGTLVVVPSVSAVLARPLAIGTNPGEDGLVAVDLVAGLVCRHLAREDCARNVDVHQRPAGGAVDVIVAVGAAVEATGLVAEGELLDQAALGQQVERAVHCPVRDGRVLAADTLEDLARSEVLVGSLHLGQDRCPLGCHPDSRVAPHLRLTPS